MHRFELEYPGKDVLLDVGSEFTLRDYLQGVQILLDSLVQGLCVHKDVGILSVFERDDFQLKLLPLITDAEENCLVFGLSVGVLDDLVNVLLVVLDVVLPQVNDRELVLGLEMRSLD